MEHPAHDGVAICRGASQADIWFCQEIICSSSTLLFAGRLMAGFKTQNGTVWWVLGIAHGALSGF